MFRSYVLRFVWSFIRIWTFSKLRANERRDFSSKRRLWSVILQKTVLVRCFLNWVSHVPPQLSCAFSSEILTLHCRKWSQTERLSPFILWPFQLHFITCFTVTVVPIHCTQVFVATCCSERPHSLAMNDMPNNLGDGNTSGKRKRLTALLTYLYMPIGMYLLLGW